jgi:hypothetical protein
MSRTRFKLEALLIEPVCSMEIYRISQKTHFPAPVMRFRYMLYGTKLEPSGLIPFREIKLSPLKTRLLDLNTLAVHIAVLPLLLGSYSYVGICQVSQGAISRLLQR